VGGGGQAGKGNLIAAVPASQQGGTRYTAHANEGTASQAEAARSRREG
jgi:hypothetical protein